MKFIPLTKGYEAIVDDDDYEWLMKFNWCAKKSQNGVYARTRISKLKCIEMHTMLMGIRMGYMIDHRNRNGLDNRRENLRYCTNAQNLLNRPPQRNNTTGFKGVTFFKGGYNAEICVNGTKHYIGRFQDPISAAVAYNEKALELEPEFAWLNQIPKEN